MADIIITEKHCTKCGILKQIADFPRATDNKSGYGAQCNPCKQQYRIQHYAKHFKGDKTCAACGLTKAADQFLVRTRKAERAKICKLCDQKQRFWSKVDKTPGHGPWGNCWIWTAYCGPDGYGSFDHMNAQIFSWELKNGPVPKGKFLLHNCDVRPCVNPTHLRPGTHLENMQDMIDRRRYYAPKLSDDDVREMRRLRHAEGMIYGAIADLFGVNSKTAYYAINGRKHIT